MMMWKCETWKVKGVCVCEREIEVRVGLEERRCR